MALPTIEKSWQVANTVVTGGVGAIYNKPAFIAIKGLLKGFGSSAWTVSGSSNSSTSNMTGTDLVLAPADIVVAGDGSPHTWVVLRQAGIATKFEVVLDFTTSAACDSFNVFVSPSAGFGTANGGTNGSNLTRPTATDQVILGAKLWGLGVGYSRAGNTWVYAAQSTDGQCTRVFTTWSGMCTAFWIMDKAKLPIAHWSDPWVVGMVGLPTTNLGYAGGYGYWTDASSLSGKINSTITDIRMTTEGPGDGPLRKTMTYPDDVTGEAPMTPVGLLATTAPVRGRKAMLFDMWCGSNGSGYNTGPTTYPADGSRLFTQVNNLIIPWAGALAPQWA